MIQNGIQATVDFDTFKRVYEAIVDAARQAGSIDHMQETDFHAYMSEQTGELPQPFALWIEMLLAGA